MLRAPVHAQYPQVQPLSTRFVLPREGIRLEDLERELLTQALQLAEGNRTKAAKLLGLSRDTFRYRVEKFGIDRA
jgi:DNA-binding NtrC family response regulator